MASSCSPDINSVFVHVPKEELRGYLFSHLDLVSLKSARCVNKLWQSVIDSFLEFHLVLSDKTKGYVEAFGTIRDVASLTTTTLKGQYPAKGLDIRTKMLRLSLKNDDSGLLNPGSRRGYAASKKLGLSHFNFRQLVKDFRFVEKFHITSLAVASFTDARMQMGRVYLPSLKEVIVTFFDVGFHQLLPFTKNYFPKLQVVNIANFAVKRKDRPILYSWIFGFVGRHGKTLHEVSLILPEGVMDGRRTIGGILGGSLHGNVISLPRMNVREDLRKDLKLPPHIYEQIKSRLENCTTLKRLIWDMSLLEGHRRYNLGTILLTSQTHLVELHLDNLHLKDRPLWNQMGQVLPKLSGTLESLSLGGCFCGPIAATLGGAHAFSGSWVKDCPRLKYVEMAVCGVSVESIEELPKSIKTLNLGHMLTQQQIEYLVCHMTNLESWVLPQRGCLVSVQVPLISVYLFQAILHLPKLTRLTIFAECADKPMIMKFVAENEGITRCTGSVCLMDSDKYGNLSFLINRDIFQRDHSQVRAFMEKYSVAQEQLNRAHVVEFVIRNIIEGEDEDDEWEEDFDEEDDLVIWDANDLDWFEIRPIFH